MYKQLVVLFILFFVSISCANAGEFNPYFKIANKYLAANSQEVGTDPVIQGGVSYTSGKMTYDLWASVVIEDPTNGRNFSNEVDFSVCRQQNKKTVFCIAYYDLGGSLGQYGDTDIVTTEVNYSINNRLSVSAQNLYVRGGFENGFDIGMDYKLTEKFSLGFNTGETPFFKDEYFSPYGVFIQPLSKRWHFGIKAQSGLGDSPVETKNNLQFFLGYAK